MNTSNLLEACAPVAAPEVAEPQIRTIVVTEKTVAGDGLTVVMGSCPEVIACLRNGGCLGPCKQD